MTNCCSLKNALFHNCVHILTFLTPITVLLVYFSCEGILSGIIIFAVLLAIVVGCLFPVFKCSFFIICDLIKKQTITKNNCEVRQVKACYLPSGLFGRRMFVTDLRPNFINKLDLYLNETIDSGFSEKDYQRVRMYLHEKYFEKTVLFRYLKFEHTARGIYITLTSYQKPALHLAVDVEYYRYSKLIKSFNVYEKYVYILKENNL